jgi:hypothetical protein
MSGFFMRRITDMTVAVLLCVAMLAPVAGASLVTPHTCCIRNVRHDIPAASSAVSHEHCGHSVHSTLVPSSSSFFTASPEAPCHRCCSCLGPVVSTRPQARPDASFLLFAPQDSHPFLHEFYPAEGSSNELSQNPGRAPPSSNSIQ